MPTVKQLREFSRISHLVYIFILFVGCRAGAASSETREAGLSLSERYVLNQLQKGEEADLSNRRTEQRVIGHQFLEDLLTGSYLNAQIKRRGIAIKSAVIKENVDVSHATIPYPVRLTDSTFEGELDLSYDTFSQGLTFDRSIFGSPSSPCEVLFIGTKVDGPVYFRDATFYSPLNFSYGRVAGEFLFDNVRYESKAEADFDSFQAQAPMFFRHDELLGTLNLTDAELFELYVENAVAQVDLQLNQAHIKRAISIQNSSVHLQAGLLYAEGDTTLENVVPIGSVNLRHSHFQSLTIKGFDEWLRRSATGGFDLEGLSFDYIEIADAQVVPHAKSMLDLFERIPYSPQPYVELEKFLRSHGEPETADETYIRMRHKERSRLSLWRKPFDWFLWISIGYGRKPWRAGIGALALVVLGTFVFRRDKMTQEEKSSDNWYRSYWFSLDLLSPIDLGVSKKWRPNDDKLRAYAQIHRVAGWVLIPLIVAAITGLIK